MKELIAKVTSTGYSSERYGASAICEKHVSEVFVGSARVAYDDEGHTAWTYHGGIDHLFGHETCVRQAIEKRVSECSRCAGSSLVFVTAWPKEERA